MNEVVANITVVFCVAACIAGGIFAWWVENRPEDNAQDEAKEKDGTKSSAKDD